MLKSLITVFIQYIEGLENKQRGAPPLGLTKYSCENLTKRESGELFSDGM